MWIIQFISPVDNTTVSAIEGPFESQDQALDYISERDHMLAFKAVATPLTPPRFLPDQSYRDAA